MVHLLGRDRRRSAHMVLLRGNRWGPRRVVARSCSWRPIHRRLRLRHPGIHRYAIRTRSRSSIRLLGRRRSIRIRKRGRSATRWGRIGIRLEQERRRGIQSRLHRPKDLCVPLGGKSLCESRKREHRLSRRQIPLLALMVRHQIRVTNWTRGRRRRRDRWGIRRPSYGMVSRPRPAPPWCWGMHLDLLWLAPRMRWALQREDILRLDSCRTSLGEHAVCAWLWEPSTRIWVSAARTCFGECRLRTSIGE